MPVKTSPRLSDTPPATGVDVGTDVDVDTPVADPPKRPRLELSLTQICASALAAVTATVAASYLGVSGTVVGAAVASVVTVTGNAVYGHSIRRTRDRVLDAVPVPHRSSAPRNSRPRPAARVDGLRALGKLASLRTIGLGCVALFVLVISVITCIELVAGRPITDVVRQQSGTGTTLFGGDPSSASSTTPTRTVIVHATVIERVTVSPSDASTAAASSSPATAAATAPTAGPTGSSGSSASDAPSGTPSASPTPGPSATTSGTGSPSASPSAGASSASPTP